MIITTLTILLLPFLMFLKLGLFGNRVGVKLSGLLGTAGMTIVAILSYYVAFQYFTGGVESGIINSDGKHEFVKMVICNYKWLDFSSIGAPNLFISLGILLDPISVMMLVVISTVSLMVHIYSLGYMHGEKGFQRYYAVLSLFSFAMLGLVVATNIFQMYIFWELVGVSSFLLISFYYMKPSAVKAAKKAFIVTRFADMFFLIGILILSFYTKTFDFGEITGNHAALVASSMGGVTFMGLSVASIATMLIFMGGAGKSAMFPFHIWLPDAMEGPTPASALIHAATMVVAGVYLVARLFPVYSWVTPDILEAIAYIGAFTSLFAAIIACTQTDIKRVLAFSTISQIAYMLVALGVSGFEGHEGLGFTASMWHLFTHAMFKALLFLGAGAIIHAVHSNEMDSMGNLRKYLPVTHITFLIACLAIAGIPPFSGFFSKDEILVAAFDSNRIIFMCQFLVAGLTAFYMFRLYYRIFWYSKKDYGHHTPHEAPANMFIPLIILAVFTCISGFFPFSKLITADGLPFEIHTEWIVAIPSVLVALFGIAIATILYKKENARPDAIVASIKDVYKYAYHKFYIDEVYLFITNKIIFDKISQPIAWFDRHIIDGFMNLTAWVTNKTSFEIRDLQSGNVQQYVWVFVMGVVTIVAFVIYL